MINNIQEPTQILYQVAKERFHLMVPLLRKLLDSDEEAYVPCVVLSTAENAKCKILAYKDTLAEFGGKAPKQDEISVWNSIYEDNLGGHTVWFAFRQPQDLNKKFFISKDQLQNDFSPEELGIFYTNVITTKLNQPAIKHLDQSDPNTLSTLIDTIIKQATVEETAFFLTSYTTVSLAMLVRSLTEELMNLQKQTGMSGTP